MGDLDLGFVKGFDSTNLKNFDTNLGFVMVLELDVIGNPLKIFEQNWDE